MNKHNSRWRVDWEFVVYVLFLLYMFGIFRLHMGDYGPERALAILT